MKKKKIVRITEGQLKKIIDKQLKEGFINQETVKLDKLINQLGYDDFGDFFNDNPGAIEILIEWIYNVPEFKEVLAMEY